MKDLNPLILHSYRFSSKSEIFHSRTNTKSERPYMYTVW